MQKKNTGGAICWQWQAFSQTTINVQYTVHTYVVHTGSTIRNCDKVKTWLDQMFWQIYQKLMLSGFLSSGNLCLIHQLKLFWPHVAFKVLEFNNLRSNITFFWCFEKKNWQNHENSCWNLALFLSETIEATWGINFHYSGSHWASVFGRFVKTSGQARSLLCINS